MYLLTEVKATIRAKAIIFRRGSKLPARPIMEVSVIDCVNG